MLKRIVTMSLLVAAGTFGTAQAQTPCDNYTIRAGDSLQSIARRAFDNPALFQLVYLANRDVIGANPNLITVGTVIQMPCEDGTNPGANTSAGNFASTVDASTVSAGAVPPLSEPVAPPTGGMTPFVAPITFVTGADYAPFTGPELPEGGMYTELVMRALEIADPNREARVDFVKDWGSHLATLLPNGAYDMGFPWYLPDCTNLEPLNQSDRERCTKFDHSDPFYEVVISMFVLADGPYARAQKPEDIYGTTICRPEGYFQFDLAQAGLIENATLVSPATPQECLRMLASGEVDVYTINQLTGEETIGALGLEAQVAEVPGLQSIQTLHVLTPKTNPMGRSQIALLNAGLRAMVESGEWFLIVSRQLSAQ
tara:strand:+ start:828 stop:1937 length:1110 start_codon:yes stop_codon:yes gene_type:complete